MIEPFVDLLFLVLVLVSVAGVGGAIARFAGWTFGSGWCDVVLWSCIGFGCLSMFMLALGLAHLYQPGILRLGAGLWLVSGVLFLVRTAPGVSRLASLPHAQLPWYQLLALALALTALAFGGLRSMAPPHGATDPLAYQLALPKIYLARHFLSFERTINGSLYPGYMNVLYVLAIALRGGALAQSLHWLLGVLSCAAIVAVGWRQLSLRIGIWGAVLFSFTPVLVFYGSQGYIDVGLCFFQIMAFWAMTEWLDRGTTRLLVLAALITGISMGIKTPGAVLLVLGAPIVMWNSRTEGVASSARRTLLFCSVAIAVASPWYIRSFLYSGNPIWPLANGLFGGLDFGHTNFMPAFVQEAIGSADQGLMGRVWGVTGSVASRVMTKFPSLWKWTWQPSSMQHMVGSYWVALLPGLLLVGVRRPALRIALFAVGFYLATILLLGANPRYSLLLFSFLALLSGDVIETILQTRSKWLGVVVVGGVVASGLCNTAWSYSLAAPTLPYLSGEVSREKFLHGTESTFGVFDYANRKLPAGATVLLQGLVKGYYCDRLYLWDHPYQRVLSYGDFTEIDDLAERMRELKITHVARSIRVPSGRVAMGYPQYFLDPFHERFRKRYLTLLYRDDYNVLFELRYQDQNPISESPASPGVLLPRHEELWALGQGRR